MNTLPEDIKDIDLRIKKIKNSQTNMLSSEIYQAREISFAFRIVIEFIAAVFIGISMGYFLDSLLKTNFIFLAIFSIFGIIAGCLNVYKLDKSLKHKEEKVDG
jgi:F0F1-type ATP synthase assembly protein I